MSMPTPSSLHAQCFQKNRMKSSLSLFGRSPAKRLLPARLPCLKAEVPGRKKHFVFGPVSCYVSRHAGTGSCSTPGQNIFGSLKVVNSNDADNHYLPGVPRTSTRLPRSPLYLSLPHIWNIIYDRTLFVSAIFVAVCETSSRKT